jgi:hypothetical protein
MLSVSKVSETATVLRQIGHNSVSKAKLSVN